MASGKSPSPIRLVPMCLLLLFLLLYAAERTGYFALLFFIPIAMCMLPLCVERLWVYAILSDLLVAAAVLFLPVPHYAWLAFVCVLAPFVPVRHALRGMKKPYAPTLLTIGIVLLWTAAVSVGLYFIGVNVLTLLPFPLSLLAGLALLFVLFLLDILYQLCLKWYQKRLRRFLLPRT